MKGQPQCLYLNFAVRSVMRSLRSCQSVLKTRLKWSVLTVAPRTLSVSWAQPAIVWVSPRENLEARLSNQGNALLEPVLAGTFLVTPRIRQAHRYSPLESQERWSRRKSFVNEMQFLRDHQERFDKFVTLYYFDCKSIAIKRGINGTDSPSRKTAV